jgi:hypothetical protein
MQFDAAITFFEKAILVSLNDEKIKEYRNDIDAAEKRSS